MVVPSGGGLVVVSCVVSEVAISGNVSMYYICLSSLYQTDPVKRTCSRAGNPSFGIGL